MKTALKLWFTHLFDYRGLMSRKNFWWAVLDILLITLVGAILYSLIITAVGLNQIKPGGSYNLTGVLIELIIPTIWGTIVTIGFWTAFMRRFHDAGLSGWLSLLLLFGFGEIICFIIALLPINPERSEKYRQNAAEHGYISANSWTARFIIVAVFIVLMCSDYYMIISGAFKGML